jgi:hypothetical protein
MAAPFCKAGGAHFSGLLQLSRRTHEMKHEQLALF